MRMHSGFVSVLAVLVVLFVAPAYGGQASPEGASAADALVGVWSVETSTSGNGESSGDPAQRGLYIFTKGGHYSAIFSTGTEARPRAAAHFDATDGEKVAQYNTIIVNSGTYEVSGSTITTKPMIAKAPEFVGGSETTDFEIAGDMLTLTDGSTTSADGVSLPPTGSSKTLRRIE